jgi:hypothetical protein
LAFFLFSPSISMHFPPLSLSSPFLPPWLTDREGLLAYIFSLTIWRTDCIAVLLLPSSPNSPVQSHSPFTFSSVNHHAWGLIRSNIELLILYICNITTAQPLAFICTYTYIYAHTFAAVVLLCARMR